MNTLSVILPVHSINNEIEEKYLHDAFGSVERQKQLPEELVIVIPKGSNVKTFIDNYTFEKVKVRVLENEGPTDFCSQVNFGVDNITTEFFTILEFDDLYSTIWFDNFYKYSEAYPNVDMFLPIVIDMTTDDKFIHFTNESIWAKDFTEKQGFLDNDTLLNFPKFQISGSVIRREQFNTVGKLKPSIKVQFGYEFLLRMSYYDKKIMTIPKLGYKKTNGRVNSLFWEYQNGETKVDVLENKFWYDTARKECYFKQDRNIKYITEDVTTN
jgi:hypothetical protein